MINMYTTTTHRVRKALFPEILIEDDVEINNGDARPSSIVDQFAEPSQLLKDAILDLLNINDKACFTITTACNLF
jgi:hypothetical protein